MIFRDYDSAIINLGILAAWAAVFITEGIVVVKWKES
jgi:ABC-type multidrug transport system permease subunit